MQNAKRRVVDLTLPVETGMAGIPKLAFYDKYRARVQAVTVINEEQRLLLQSEKVDLLPDAEAIGSMNTVLTLSAHLGTHIDAPRHFHADGDPVDRIDLDRLVMREAVVLDVSHKQPGEGVRAEDLERTGVRPASHEIAVIKTSWTDRAWGTAEFWDRMIHLEPSVSEWILDRGVVAVAMDCFPEKTFWNMSVAPEERGANHKRWLKAGVPMIQLLTNLNQLGSRFILTALPLRLKGMDGSPARVVGVDQN